MKNFFAHIRKYIIRGLLAIIPLALTYFAVRFLYTAIDQKAVGIVRKIFGYSFPGLGILLVLISLYILGFLASNVIGKQIFRIIEKTTKRIPLIRTTYRVGQKLGDTLSLPEKQRVRDIYLPSI